MAGKAPLSVVILTLDEAHNLPACLASVAWAAEVIVIDSLSRDGTAAIARASGARVVVRPFTGYGDQRNHGAGLALHDWILCIDADERVSPELGAEIQDGLARGFPRGGYRIRRRSRFLGRSIRYCGWQRDRPLRLYDRRLASWNDRLVHERVELRGEPGLLTATLAHETFRDLAHFAGKSAVYAERGARELHRTENQAGVIHILLLPPARFFKMYVLGRGFLDGLPGFILCALAAYGVFLKYAHLWELARPSDPPSQHPDNQRR